jgi:outer membrane lipoprotein-sorting protein
LKILDRGTLKTAWAGTLLGALLSAAALTAAEDPKYSAYQVFDRMLAAQESQAFYSAQVEKAEGPVGEKPVSISRGQLRTAPGGLARMDINEPSPGLVLADGKKLWVELAEVQQVMLYDQAKLKASGNFFLDLASSVRHYSKAAYKRLIVPGPDFDEERVTALELLPKQADKAGFERLQVWVDHQRWTVLRVLMDYGGTRSDIRFSDITILSQDELKKAPKKGPKPDLFKYRPPKGFEIFDLDL